MFESFVPAGGANDSNVLLSSNPHRSVPKSVRALLFPPVKCCRQGLLRVRITRRLHGRIDGIQLSQFVAGHVYDLSAVLGCYLMAIDGAALVLDDLSTDDLPLEQQGIDRLPRSRALTSAPLAEAADRSTRRRQRRRRSGM